MRQNPSVEEPHRQVEVLGLRLACVDYEGALAESKRLARESRPAAVSACNTHILSAARQNPDFGLVMARFDLVFPDSTPLRWVMNARGAGLADRVYGPYFMRHALQHCGPEWKHFFFGGSEECLRNLTAAARTLNPQCNIVGTLSPPFGKWDEAANADYARIIQEHNPDFIWVALGGERQERWIVANQHRFASGVFFAIGDAFELLAGHRPFAPAWMQKAGLTWLYRLWQEPVRLWRRYLWHNSLFLFQLLGEQTLMEKDFRQARRPGALRVAFVGSRGVPARYAGFETVVAGLGADLHRRGHEVVVYNRSSYYPDHRQKVFDGMRVFYFPTIRMRSLETICHTFLSVCHALAQPYDVIYLCGVGNAWFAGVLRWWGKRVVINVDGIDFKRRKWTGLARWWLWQSEKWAGQYCDAVIADNGQVVEHYAQQHGFKPLHLVYGVEPPAQKPGTDTLARHGLTPDGYILFVGRLSPENRADLLLEAMAAGNIRVPLVVVGPTAYEHAYRRKLERMATEQVHFLEAVYGEGYRELSYHARFFVLPAAIEATRLVLLDQMSFGQSVIFLESPATREVIGEAGLPFSGPDEVAGLVEAMQKLHRDDALRAELGEAALRRVREKYSWEVIGPQYEQLWASLFPALKYSPKKVRAHPPR